MPNSQRDPFDVTALRSYLSQTLRNSHLTEEAVDAHYLPLLLLEWTHLRAAFAFSNGDLRKSYGTLYHGFKQLYAREKGRWDALDRAFVFCVHPETPNLDEFCSSVETDVYFCRKFVVALTQPLGNALARLPFLPLNALEGEHPLRPPSAQTLLKACGVQARLANVVVVPKQLSAERIVSGCTHGEFGDPTPPEFMAVDRVPTIERETAPVVIDAVTIENFRAYRKRQVFELGSDVTVLYGPNGFGKTSFFDAIDFAITGGIGRIDSRRGQQLEKAAKHLDSGSEESSVTVSFRSAGSSLRNIKRTVTDRNHAALDGHSVDRKTVLGALTGSTGGGSEHVDNLVNLFRATHLFSQEQQELVKGFKDDSFPAETVSRMLAFEDYASARTKLKLVCDHLRVTIDQASTEGKERASEIELAKRELAGYRERMDREVSAEGLSRAMSELRASLVALEVAKPGESMTTAELRGWRGELELRISESQARTDRLTELVPQIPRLQSIRTEVNEASERARKIEGTLVTIQKTISEAERARDATSERLAKTVEVHAALLQTGEAISWCRTTGPQYSTLVDQKQNVAAQVEAASSECEREREAEEQASADAGFVGNVVSKIVDDLEARQRHLRMLGSMAEDLIEWRANQRRLEEVTEGERKGLQQLELLRSDEQNIRLRHTEVESTEARLAREVERADQTQTALRRLLLEIQIHVRGATCPVCGTEHGSKEHLVERIGAQVEGDPSAAERAELSRLRAEREVLDEALARNQESQGRLKRENEQAQAEKARLGGAIASFLGAAEAVGIAPTSPIHTPEEEIESRRSRLLAEREDLVAEQGRARDQLEEAQKRTADRKTSLTEKERELSNLRRTLGRIGRDIDSLAEDPRTRVLALDTDVATLDDRERLSRDQLTQIQAQRATLEDELNTRQTTLSARTRESELLSRQLGELRSKISEAQTERSQIEARIAAAKLPPDVDAVGPLARIGDEARLRAGLVASRDSASALEMAIDAATTAAAHDRLRQDIQTKERELSVVVRRKEEHQPWLTYFERVAELVSSQQSKAIATFTTEYGPRASTIQRRLRPVYGFDDVEVRGQESSISVRVWRRGEELQPTQYFSQSQVQTLFLSLFLTACVSQTWSSLSPIFMDDPVTHFDDLNTYAFLDLIVGLLEVEGEGRQFVISTCDEKLLQLARQKFRHLGNAARFYRFSAIGPEGPVVNEGA